MIVGLLTVGFAMPSLPAGAAAVAAPAAHVVLFASEGTETQHVTSARTVGAFLQARGIVVGPHDYVRPALDTPLSDNMEVHYTAAVPVHLITPSGKETVFSAAGDIGAFLQEQSIALGPHDIVQPSRSEPLVAGSIVRVTRVRTWVSREHRHIAERTVHEIDFALPPGKRKIVAEGRPGLRVTMVDYTQTNGRIAKHVVGSRLVRKPKERIIAEGVGTSERFAAFAKRDLQKTAYMAESALRMVATAYTAECAGCSGYTASGYRAGRGIVAVDPRIIPLGTKLFIPGYGFAIAGDTGGAIVGNRIDLGFNSIGDAMNFGRRIIRVYRLK